MNAEFQGSQFQLHGAAGEWNGVLRPPAKDPLPGHSDKPTGFFWTSSERADGSSAWIDICPRPPINRQLVAIHRFQIIASPRVLTLRRRRQLIDLAIDWNLIPDFEPLGNWMQYCIDANPMETWDGYVEKRLGTLLNTNEFWGKAQNYFDAVHVPDDASFQEKWLDSFQVESCVWFRPHLHLRHLGSSKCPLAPIA